MSNSNRNPDYHEANDIARVHTSVRREKEDYKVGIQPVHPLVMLLGAFALVFGGLYLGSVKNGYGSSYVKDSRPAATGAGVALSPLEKAMKAGAVVYGTCGGCHQTNGMGLPGQFPPLADSEWVKGSSERMAYIVVNGLIGPVHVKEATYDVANGMPAQKSVMSDRDIANVMTYVRNSWGNKASSVAPEGVSKIREASKDHPQMTEADLLKIDGKSNLPEIESTAAAAGAVATPTAPPAPAPKS